MAQLGPLPEVPGLIQIPYVTMTPGPENTVMAPKESGMFLSSNAIMWIAIGVVGLYVLSQGMSERKG